LNLLCSIKPRNFDDITTTAKGALLNFDVNVADGDSSALSLAFSCF
jgi:hypothetical protein